jgi:hypothetical protein
MLDEDLVEIYGVELRRVNEQVKHNIARFPVDLMVQLRQEEFENFKWQFGTTSWQIFLYQV